MTRISNTAEETGATRPERTTRSKGKTRPTQGTMPTQGTLPTEETKPTEETRPTRPARTTRSKGKTRPTGEPNPQTTKATDPVTMTTRRVMNLRFQCITFNCVQSIIFNSISYIP